MQVNRFIRIKLYALTMLMCVYPAFHLLAKPSTNEAASVMLVSPQIATYAPKQSHKIITILSVDGGGMYGLVPAYLLVELEKRIGQPISKLFDIMVGTSTGSILIGGLSIVNKKHQPKYTAYQMKNFYRLYGPNIFKKSLWHSIKTLNGLIGPKFSSHNLQITISQLADKKTKLSDLASHVSIPCGVLIHNEPLWLSNDSAKKNKQKDFYINDVITAATSASGIFKPFKFTNTSNTWHDYGFDAAIYINNPTLQAYRKAKLLYPHHKFLIVSLGTGIASPNQDLQKPKDFEHWGLIQGIIPTILKSMQFHSAEIDHQIREITEDQASPLIAYYRFNVRRNQYKHSGNGTFNGSEKNLRYIKKLGRHVIKHNQSKINNLVFLLNKIKSQNNATPSNSQ